MSLTQQQYRDQAYNRAFGDRGEDWIPSRGFGANRPRIVKLYEYYKTIFNLNPDRFLWAGLGRMAGGSVVGGLDFMTGMPYGDSNPIANTMVEVGKAIFEDLAWLHEAYLDDPAAAIVLAGAYDLARRSRRSYAEALTRIFSGDVAQIAEGNKALLEIEQYSIIQPLYDRLRNSNEYGMFRLARTATANVHPYHRDFILASPTIIPWDITVFNDRWAWITEPGGMWEKWAEGYRGPTVGVSSAERSRLVNLPFDKIVRRDFAPIDQSLLPPGANY